MTNNIRALRAERGRDGADARLAVGDDILHSAERV